MQPFTRVWTHRTLRNVLRSLGTGRTPPVFSAMAAKGTGTRSSHFQSELFAYASESELRTATFRFTRASHEPLRWITIKCCVGAWHCKSGSQAMSSQREDFGTSRLVQAEDFLVASGCPANLQLPTMTRHGGDRLLHQTPQTPYALERLILQRLVANARHVDPDEVGQSWHRLQDLTGRLAVLEFPAHGCLPTRAEAPLT